MSGSAYITRLSSFLPHAPVGNDQIESVLGQVGPQPSRARRVVLRSNGIRSRHYAIDPATGLASHSNAGLAAEAVRRLQDAHFDLRQLDCLTAATSIADQIMPSHAVMVHGEIGAPPCEVISTAGVCGSGMSALKCAWMAVRLGEHRRAVTVASERPSAVLRAREFAGEIDERLEQLEKNPVLAFEKDFLRWMLSDGAGAVLLEDQPRADSLSLRIDWIDTLSYANEIATCMYAGADKRADGSLLGWVDASASERDSRSLMAIKQDVRLLNDNIQHYTVIRPLRHIIAKRGLKTDDFDFLLPHYSSEYFHGQLVDALAQVGLPIPESRWFTNLTRCGNTGAASIFIILAEIYHSGAIRRGQRLLCYVPESGRFSAAWMQLTAV